LARHITALPEQLRRSLTWDQGKDMAAHARFSVATGVPVYFCDPRSPWQRGSNENTNGLPRQYLPKRSDLTPSPNTTSTPSPPNSTNALDKPSAG
jgi:transposase, IS30 family